MTFPSACLAFLMAVISCTIVAPRPMLAGSADADPLEPHTPFTGVNRPAQTDSSDREAARLHLLAGISAGLVGGGIAALTTRPWQHPRHTATVLVWSTAGATGAGIAKEIADLFGFGQPSVSDAVITAAGGFAVAGLVAGFAANAPTDAAGTAISAGAVASGLLVSIPVVSELLRRLRSVE